jgi:tetratricopeptide (TPR) repeat protein
MAFNSGYDGRRAEAIDLITEARHVARAADGPRTRGWLAAVESELRARTGDARASLAALADAESALQDLDQRDARPWIGVGAFDAAKLKGYYGLCYLQLRQPQEAVRELTAAVNALDPTLRKHRCTALADLATALIQLGEVEEGCRRASQALTLAMELRHAVSVDRIRNLDRHLAPWQDTTAVKTFREQLLEQLLVAFQASPSIDW